MPGLDSDFIRDCLRAEETNYATATSEKAKLNHMYSIISYKSILSEHDSMYVYKDIKQYINHAISCVDSEMYGYDKLNRGAIDKLLQRLDKKQKVEIAGYLLRRIKSAGIVDEEAWALAKFKKCEMNYLMSDGWRDKGKLSNVAKLVLSATSYNLFALLVWAFLSYIVVLTVLLPAKYDCFQLFDITYHHYFDSELLNHSANVLSLLLGMQNDMKVTPINLLGFVLVAMAKLFVIVIVTNYGMKLLEKRLNS